MCLVSSASWKVHVHTTTIKEYSLNNIFKKSIAIVGASVLLLSMAACTPSQKAGQEINNAAENRSPYIPKNSVEYDNYNKAQELFDNPSAIIWCTAFPNGGSAPVITTPIKGKLTSSSTSYFAGSDANGENRSVDGMYHGNPPGYRFGFTPGGAYVSFEGGINVICTTQLTEFQRQKTFVSIDNLVSDNQKAAENALKTGDSQKAVELLKEEAVSK